MGKDVCMYVWTGPLNTEGRRKAIARFGPSVRKICIHPKILWSSSTDYHSSRNRSLVKVSNINLVPCFASLQHKFNVQVPLGYTFQRMSVGEDSNSVSCVSPCHFVTTPNAEQFIEFLCTHRHGINNSSYPTHMFRS